ncbi:MAG: hypothetical protein PHW62_01540 [Candidatus Ratteibacteria bacterium]|nr:hypothetical protein [Candidatus Ratteibacteria bacterium]
MKKNTQQKPNKWYIPYALLIGLILISYFIVMGDPKISNTIGFVAMVVIFAIFSLKFKGSISDMFEWWAGK